MTDYFETRVENLDPKEEKQKPSVISKKLKKSFSTKKKRKRADSDPSVVESSEEFITEHRSFKKNCVLHGKCNHSVDQCKNLRTLVS